MLAQLQALAANPTRDGAFTIAQSILAEEDLRNMAENDLAEVKCLFGETVEALGISGEATILKATTKLIGLFN